MLPVKTFVGISYNETGKSWRVAMIFVSWVNMTGKMFTFGPPPEKDQKKREILCL